MNDAWYTGVLTSWDGKASTHQVLYDDGVTETLNLQNEAVRIFNTPDEEERMKAYSLAGKCFLCMKAGKLLCDVVDGTQPEPAHDPTAPAPAAAVGAAAASSSTDGAAASGRDEGDGAVQLASAV